jgi:hypothetical protein
LSREVRKMWPQRRWHSAPENLSRSSGINLSWGVEVRLGVDAGKAWRLGLSCGSYCNCEVPVPRRTKSQLQDVCHPRWFMKAGRRRIGFPPQCSLFMEKIHYSRSRDLLVPTPTRKVSGGSGSTEVPLPKRVWRSRSMPHWSLCLITRETHCLPGL